MTEINSTVISKINNENTNIKYQYVTTAPGIYHGQIPNLCKNAYMRACVEGGTWMSTLPSTRHK